MKYCRVCKTQKPLNEFPHATRYKDGHASECKVCHSKRSVEYRNRPEIKARHAAQHVVYYQENKEKRQQYSAEYNSRPEVRARTKNRRLLYSQLPEVKARAIVKERKRRELHRLRDIRGFKMQTLLNAARNRAKRKGLDFSITESDLGDWRKIETCAVFPWITFDWSHSKCQDNSPTIDRIDNNLGYVPGNVRIVSWRANSLKSDSTEREAIALGLDVASG